MSCRGWPDRWDRRRTWARRAMRRVFGEVVLVSVPYGALPQVGRDLKSELAGKIVLDTGNPYPQRDGEMAVAARAKGTGVASAEYLARRAPGARVQRHQLRGSAQRGSPQGRADRDPAGGR